MDDLKQNLESVKNEFMTALHNANTEQELEQVRIAFLGRNGRLTSLMSNLKNLSLEEKRTFGPLFNELKTFADSSMANKQQELLERSVALATGRQQNFDVTALLYNPLQGRTHLYTKIIQQMQDIFISMGWSIADGPEIETDYYNFEALNIPKDHPARESHDTFWVDVPGLLMRTHTSPVQVHQMEKHILPLAVFAPGRCYRNEATDATHEL